MERARSWAALAVLVLTLFVIQAGAQNCTPPPWGLAHWWRGEGNAFDTVSVQDGTLIGGVQFTNGQVGTAFLFSGSGDDYIALPQNLFPMPGTGEGHSPFSFEFWFQTTSSGVILGQQDLPPFNSDLGGSVPAVYVGTNGFLYVQMFWSEAPQLTSLVPVNDGAFHHVVVTYDGATEILYLDGGIIGSTPFVQEAYASVYYYEFGTGYTGGWDETTGDWFPFQGVLDEPSLYTRALSPLEVATLFHSGAAGKCAPPDGLVLRHRYSFDGQPSDVVVKDSVRNADGDLVFGSSQAPYTNGIPDGSGFSGNGTLELNGTNGCVILPPRLLSVLSNFTVEAWVTWNGPSSSVWQRLFDFGLSDHGTNADSIGTNYIIFTPNRGGTEVFGFEETTVNPFGTNVDPEALILTSNGTFPIGEEVYVAMTYDPLGGSSRLYLNGALVGSASGSFNPTGRFTDYSDWLGRSQWDRDPYFNGSYDEFRIWQGVLSDQQIASHYVVGPDQQFVTARPVLAIERNGPEIILSWPSAGADAFTLQTTSTLTAPNWVALTNGITLSEGFYRLAVPATAASAFYRLGQ